MVFDAALVIGLAVACLITTSIYGLGSPFWRHITGVGLFTILVAATVVTGLSAMRLIGVYDHNLARVAYILAILAVSTMGVIIVREQIAGRKQERLNNERIQRQGEQHGKRTR